MQTPVYVLTCIYMHEQKARSNRLADSVAWVRFISTVNFSGNGTRLAIKNLNYPHMAIKS